MSLLDRLYEGANAQAPGNGLFREAAEEIERLSLCISKEQTAHERTRHNASVTMDELGEMREDYLEAVRVAAQMADKHDALLRRKREVDAYAEELAGAAHRLINLAGKAFDLLEADEDMKCLKLLMAMGGGSPGYRADIDDIHATLAKHQRSAVPGLNPENAADSTRGQQAEGRASRRAVASEDGRNGIGSTPFVNEIRQSPYHKLDNERQVFFYEQDFYVLSNFSAFSLEWDGYTFATSEAAYHYEKFPDHIGLRDAIRLAPSAHEAFKIAEGAKEYRRDDWDAIKVDTMLDILRAKAQQHEYVRRKLLATGDRELIEDSWRDSFWGWGPNRDGQNMLGKCWMRVRAEIPRWHAATPSTRTAP